MGTAEKQEARNRHHRITWVDLGNAREPMVAEPGTLTVTPPRLEQPWNASSPMLVTESGMVTLVRPEQL